MSEERFHDAGEQLAELKIKNKTLGTELKTLKDKARELFS